MGEAEHVELACKPITQLVSVPRAQTSEELLIKLQQSIDPEPLNPTELRGFYEPARHRGHTPSGRTEAQLCGPASLFKRFPSLGSLSKPAWLSG
jgi:hypothetical protein